MKRTTKKPAVDTATVVTKKLIAMMEQGTVPWRQPWRNDGVGFRWPMNLARKRAYRGANALILAISDYTSPYWVTFKQAKKLGGHVRADQKGTQIIFWKTTKRSAQEIEDAKERGERPSRRRLLLRYYTVFNVQQCDDITLPTEAQRDTGTFVPVDAAEAIVAGYQDGPELRHGGDRACYIPAFDQIRMPTHGQFTTPDNYYATLFHELTHSTGHPKRLDREGVANVQPFGTEDYSKEELVAELGSAFLMAQVGMESTLPLAASYLTSWLSKLNDDKGLVIYAAAQAQHAVDRILGTTEDDDEEGDE